MHPWATVLCGMPQFATCYCISRGMPQPCYCKSRNAAFHYYPAECRVIYIWPFLRGCCSYLPPLSFPIFLLKCSLRRKTEMVPSPDPLLSCLVRGWMPCLVMGWRHHFFTQADDALSLPPHKNHYRQTGELWNQVLPFPNEALVSFTHPTTVRLIKTNIDCYDQLPLSHHRCIVLA